MPAPDRHGVALPIAIFAVVVLGLLISASFLLGIWEQRMGRAAVRLAQAAGAAEAGGNTALSSWDSRSFGMLMVGDSAVLSGSVGPEVGWFRATVVRLSEELFFIRSEGFSSDFAARRAVGLAVHIAPSVIDLDAAFATSGSVGVRRSMTVSGQDESPGGWDFCPPAGADVPAVRLGDSLLSSVEDCADCLLGSVPLEVDTSLAESALSWGDVDFYFLVDRASTRVGPGPHSKIGPRVGPGGACQTSDPANWGDPKAGGPCSSYLPIIFAPDGARIVGGVGQGILLVEGDLELQGGFSFVGAVFVTGDLAITGSGADILGGVAVGGPGEESVSRLEQGTIRYSSCALWRALTRASGVAPLRERFWSPFF